MGAIGTATPDMRAVRHDDVAIAARPYHALGGALHRLGRALDEVLLADSVPPRKELRSLRLLGLDALRAIGAALEELNGRRWSGSFEAGLRATAAEFGEATGAAVHVRVSGDVEAVDADAIEALRLVVTETLHNVNRNARACFVVISLAVDDKGVMLDIVDDGVALPMRQVAAWGSMVDLGLRRMNVAIRSVRGSMRILALQPRGLRVRAVVPLPAGACR